MMLLNMLRLSSTIKTHIKRTFNSSRKKKHQSKHSTKIFLTDVMIQKIIIKPTRKCMNSIKAAIVVN